LDDFGIAVSGRQGSLNFGEQFVAANRLQQIFIRRGWMARSRPLPSDG
jgi:hypothetical protein